MKQIVTTGIVLSRTDFQEADRILTILTPDQGKVRVLAKGVRRQKSKLAGGIELLSVSNITYLPGRGELGTLISTRLLTHYGQIVTNIDRTMLAYEFIKQLNRLTEDAAGEEYYQLLMQTLRALDDLDLPLVLIQLWFAMQLLKVTGHTPNLKTDVDGNKLEADKTYIFDFDAMTFKPQRAAGYTANHIRLLRLAYSTDEPHIMKQVTDATIFADDALKLVRNALKLHIRI